MLIQLPTRARHRLIQWSVAARQRTPVKDMAVLSSVWLRVGTGCANDNSARLRLGIQTAEGQTFGGLIMDLTKPLGRSVNSRSSSDTWGIVPREASAAALMRSRNAGLIELA